MNSLSLRRVLLLCTGNTCRSPMAGELLRAALRERLGEQADQIEVRTAGVAVARHGEEASPYALEALAERGLILTGHKARQLTAGDLVWAQLVLTMTSAQKAEVLRLAPFAADRAFVLREYTAPGACACVELDIADPIGRGLDAYRSVASDLEKELAKLVEVIAGEEGSGLTAMITAGAAITGRPETAPAAVVQPWASGQSLAVGADHAGYQLKHELSEIAAAMGFEVVDFGTSSGASVDYPDYAVKVAAAVASGRCKAGLLVCGTGTGMAIAANKIRGVRAATCNDLFLARMAREHNDANILCIGARVVGAGLAAEILRVFLGTPFGGDRHAGRVRKIGDLEAPPRKEPC